jgi:hypothetical protein
MPVRPGPVPVPARLYPDPAYRTWQEAANHFDSVLHFTLGANPSLGNPVPGTEVGSSAWTLGGGGNLGVVYVLPDTGGFFLGGDLRVDMGIQTHSDIRLSLVRRDVWRTSTVAKLFQASLGPYLGLGFGRIYALLRPALCYERIYYKTPKGDHRFRDTGTGMSLGLGVGIRMSVRISLQFFANLHFPSSPHEGTERRLAGPVPVYDSRRATYTLLLSFGLVARL